MEDADMMLRLICNRVSPGKGIKDIAAGASLLAGLANQWISTVNGMRSRTSLDDEQARILQVCLQMHAKDSASANDGQGKP
jgi:hypothetical protein